MPTAVSTTVTDAANEVLNQDPSSIALLILRESV